jgi:RNA polymerase I-specific transcription initiation factor RRN6
MSNFPTITPAFTVHVTIDAPMSVGGQTGSSLVIVPMVGGTVKSEAGFEPAFNGELYVHFIHVMSIFGTAEC